MEIGPEIVRHTLACRVLVRSLHPVVPVVDAPEVVREPFPEMSEDDLQPRTFVEQAAADQSQCVQGRFGREAPGVRTASGAPRSGA